MLDNEEVKKVEMKNVESDRNSKMLSLLNSTKIG